MLTFLDYYTKIVLSACAVHRYKGGSFTSSQEWYRMPTLHPDTHQIHRLTNGLNSLTPKHCIAVAAALGSAAPGWLVELHHDENGGAIIVIMPDEIDDDGLPTLVIRTKEGTFSLEELCGDAYWNLDEHPVWGNLLRAVQIRLLWEMPTSMTLH